MTMIDRLIAAVVALFIVTSVCATAIKVSDMKNDITPMIAILTTLVGIIAGAFAYKERDGHE